MGMTVRNLELTSCAFLKNLQQCLMMMSKTSFWSKLARVFGRLNCPLQAERNRERLLTTLFLWFLAEKNFNFHGMTSIVILSSRPIISSHLLKNQASIEKKCMRVRFSYSLSLGFCNKYWKWIALVKSLGYKPPLLAQNNLNGQKHSKFCVTKYVLWNLIRAYD